MASTWDPRFGVGWPNCDQNQGRVMVRLDFGLGAVFTVAYQSGAVVPLLKAVFRVKAHNELAKDAPYKVRVAGTFACRSMRTHNKASLHSLPLAIDINPDTNRPDSPTHDIPGWFVECFRAEGFTWGGDWKDWMHFENNQWAGEWDGTYPEGDDMDERFTKFLEALGAKDDPKKPATPEGAAQRLKALEKAPGPVVAKVAQHRHKPGDVAEEK